MIASSSYSWSRVSNNRKMLKRLLKQITIEETRIRHKSKGIFYGKTFVLTGTLKSFTRDEVKEEIRKTG